MYVYSAVHKYIAVHNKAYKQMLYILMIFYFVDT